MDWILKKKKKKSELPILTKDGSSGNIHSANNHGVSREWKTVKPTGIEMVGTSLQGVEYENADIRYRRAYQTMLITDIFAYFDCLIAEESQNKLDSVKSKTTHFKELHQKQELLFKRVHKFLSIILQYRKTRGQHYTIIFYEYMCTIKSEQELDVFHYYCNSSYSTICGYIQALSFYVHHKDSQYSNTTNVDDAIQILDDCYEEAHLLLNFLEEHKIDPYSTMVGLSPSRDILKCTINDASKKDLNGYFDIIPPRELYESIMLWANSVDDSDQIVAQIKQCATLLRGVDKLKKGDLVILEIPREKVSENIIIKNENEDKDISNGFNGNKKSNLHQDRKVYKIVRFSGVFRNDKQTMEVYISPMCDATRESLVVNMENVYPFPYYIVKNLMDDHYFSFEKFVESPILLFHSEILEWIQSKTREFLQSKSVEYSLLWKAMANQCTILDLPELRRSYKVLESLDLPQSLFEEVDDFYKNELNRFLKELNHFNLFQPTKESSLSKITSFPCATIVSKEIKKYSGMFDCSLDQIELQRRDLINGTRKSNLVDWWHLKINDSITKALVSMDYYTNAIPNDYIMEPPADLKKVASNFKLLREVLDGDTRASLIINEVIEKLKKDIYVRINAFIMDAVISILEFLKLPCGENDLQTFNADEISNHISTHYSPQDKEVNWVRELIKDVKYLKTMKRLESTDCSSEERMDAFHIVPVSGLAYGMICRLENETKTVIELWAPLAYMRKCTGDERFHLHRAISLGDHAQIEQILANKSANLNERDENGWTPLHCASSSEKYFSVCKALINAGAKVNIMNYHGNTPLHYLAKCRLEARDNLHLQIEVLKLMIEHGVNLDFKNSEGETPLHFACLVGNVEFVRTLVYSLCDVSGVNNDNESCLHYAVLSNNKQIVNILLESGANLHCIDKRGRTPMSIAMQLSTTAIADVLKNFSPAHKFKSWKPQSTSLLSFK